MMKNTFEFEPQNFNELIDWFWQEWDYKKFHVDRDGFCQCESENLIKHSSNSDVIRAFLMVSVFIDQFFYTHYNDYESFRSKFKIPKLHSHPTAGHHPASWFCYGIRGAEISIDWLSVEKIASIAINDIKKSEENIEYFFIKTKKILPAEILMEFNSYGEITECGEKFKETLLKHW